MKTYRYKEADLSFIYPDNWTVLQETNIISVFDSEHGLGALQFSFYQVGNAAGLLLKDELEEYIKKRHGSAEVLKSKDFVFSNYLEGIGKRYWKYWLFLKTSVLIFVSYNCQEEDIGKEDEIVGNIIHSAVRVI
jgi:hypothetical protein